MNFLILSGKDCYPEAWNDFRGVMRNDRELESTKAMRLAAGDEWMEIIDIATWKMVTRLHRGHPPCRNCKGVGHFNKWLNSVGADKVLRPMAHRFICKDCNGGGLDKTEPALWMPT